MLFPPTTLLLNLLDPRSVLGIMRTLSTLTLTPSIFYYFSCCAEVKLLTVYRYTTPGGWAEFQDFDVKYYSEDGSMTPDMAIARWDRQVIEGCSKIGRDASPGPKLLGWMRDAGFTNLHHTRRVLPIGMWPKDEVMVRVARALYFVLRSRFGPGAFTVPLGL
jgi:hypothetical protein